MIDKSQLKVANTPETEFLVQAELKAISEGLEYIEMSSEEGFTYRGYKNQNNVPEGPGIKVNKD